MLITTVTHDTYQLLDQAYAFFNLHLFLNSLPAVAITLQPYRRAYGYFHTNQFSSKANARVGVIVLNPDAFLIRDTKAILSTVVHEMAHVWQHEYGKPSRNGYHNKEYALRMKAIGLIVTSTGKPGGKSTGQSVWHYIERGGPFDQNCTELLKTMVDIVWGTVPSSRKTEVVSKLKFTCPSCGQNAWAKPSAYLLCGVCHEAMLSQKLLPRTP